MKLPNISVLMGVFLILCSSEGRGDIKGIADIIDGDSLKIANDEIRLFGIDAPEFQQTCKLPSRSWPCGVSAMKALHKKINTQSVQCYSLDRDSYGRIVAECFIQGENLNAWMVREGWAVAYRRYSTKYTSAEGEARLSKKGLWRSEFVLPWLWRRQHQ